MTRLTYRLFVLAWTTVVFSVVTMFACITAGIFIDGGDSEPWGELAGMFGGMGAFTLFGTTIWTVHLTDNNELHRPEPTAKLSRDDRKKLKAERSRIELERTIQQLEHENLS